MKDNNLQKKQENKLDFQNSKSWLKYYSSEDKSKALPEMSLFNYIYECNRTHLNDYCIYYFEHKYTYSEFFKKVDACAKSLLGMGVKKNEVVSICMPNIPEAVYLIYAINKIGAISNLLIFNSTQEELEHHIKETNSRVLFTVDFLSDNILSAGEKVSGLQVIIVNMSNLMPLKIKIATLFTNKHSSHKYHYSNIKNWTDFLSLGNHKNVQVSQQIKNPNELAVIVYTGGTTGISKGVMLSDNNINAVAFDYGMSPFRFERRTTLLDPLPPFFAFGVSVGMHCTLSHGLINIITPIADPEKFPELFLHYKPNHFVAGPLHIENLVQNKKVQNMNLSFLKTAAYGGDSMPEKTEKEYSRFFADRGNPYGVIKGYGMSETAGTVCSYNHKFSGLIPLLHCDFVIADSETGKLLNNTEEGEILVSGPSVMLGYFNNVKATEDVTCFIQGKKWLRTGDLGFFNLDGTLTLTGRIKRVFWKIGPDRTVYRIYPFHIEEEILQYPCVKECVVVGISTKLSGYRIVLYCVLKEEGIRQVDLYKADIINFCKLKLKEIEVPDEVKIIDKLPLTKAGKTNYRALEKMAESISAQTHTVE